MNVTVKITKSGGLFTDPVSIVNRGVRDSENTLAETGRELIRSRLDVVLRHPTGRYKSSIAARRTARGAEVTDSGVIYGPWLEGTSRRNDISRFKGYATFRRTRDELERRKTLIVRRDVADMVRRLN